MFLRSLAKIILLSSLTGLTFANIIFDPVHNTCGSSGASLLQEIMTMGSYAFDRMDHAKSGQLDPWETYRVISTFDTFFDTTLHDIQAWFDHLKDRMKQIGNVGSTAMDIFVACDDAPFWDATDPNALIFHDPNQGNNVVYSRGQKTCAIGNTNGLNLIAYRMAQQNVQYIFLCMKQNQGHLYLNQMQVAEGDSIDDKSTLSTTFFHEMMHASFGDMKGDMSGGTAPDSERYIWLETRQVRSTYSLQNPDSLTLFALALAFDELLWDTGLGQSSKSRYNWLLQNEPAILQRFNLPKPS